MEASALTHASRRGLLARRPVLRLEKDERLIALIRDGHDRAFEALFERYHSRLLAFCQSMLRSHQDAEDVLQDVFANAHKAILADNRAINVRPWLYRIARNRCLNHLRKPVPEGQESMDVHPHLNGTTTAQRVQEREELRQVLSDVGTLPETQKTALLLREIEQLSYGEIAVAMDTTVPAVKSLLVRARITLAESSEARTLSCEEVRVALAEAAEGLGKASGPVRLHVKACGSCSSFRDRLRDDRRELGALVPFGPLAALKATLIAKLFGGGAAGAGGGGAATTGAAATGSSAAIGTIGGGAAAGGSAASGLGALGGALGGKAAAGVATAAVLTAGAVEVRQETNRDAPPTAIERTESQPPAPAPPRPEPSAKPPVVAAPATASEDEEAAGDETESPTQEEAADEKATDGTEEGEKPAKGEKGAGEASADEEAADAAGETGGTGTDSEALIDEDSPLFLGRDRSSEGSGGDADGTSSGQSAGDGEGSAAASSGTGKAARKKPPTAKGDGGAGAGGAPENGSGASGQGSKETGAKDGAPEQGQGKPPKRKRNLLELLLPLDG